MSQPGLIQNLTYSSSLQQSSTADITVCTWISVCALFTQYLMCLT